MNSSALIVFALSALAIVLFQSARLFLPVAAAAVRDRGVPIKGWLLLGLVLLFLAGGAMTVLRPTPEQVRVGTGIAAAMLAGILAKSLWDASLSSVFQIDGRALLRALLVAPIVVVGGWKIFEGAPTLQTLLLVFSNGFFWQTVFSDVSKRMEQQANKSGRRS
jgi:hypothetical protein